MGRGLRGGEDGISGQAHGAAIDEVSGAVPFAQTGTGHCALICAGLLTRGGRKTNHTCSHVWVTWCSQRGKMGQMRFRTALRSQSLRGWRSRR
eukprot:5781959-Prymnesium_polylepis.1